MRRGILAILGAVERDRDVSGLAGRRGLQATGSLPGVQVFASSELPSRTLGDNSLVIGDLFASSGASGDETNLALAWGNFLSFAARLDEVQVVRAPLTGLPLYWQRVGGALLCASSLSLLDELAPRRAIDWDFVAEALAYVNLRSARTGIAGVSELLPGSRLRWNGRKESIESFWSPWDHVADQRRESATDLAPELEQRIIACTGDWIRSRPKSVLELSGGLDSSIVAAALTAAEADFRAITMATPGADGDERRFARAVADRCGFELVETLHDASAVDLASTIEGPGFRPAAYSVLGGIDRAFVDALPGGDEAIFSGVGGDNVFAFDGTVAPIVDVFDTLGPGPAAFRALRDRARAADATIWHAARLAWRARRQGPRAGWRRDTSYLNEARLPSRPPPHPWDEGAGAVSQAKRNHGESIRRIIDFLDRPMRWRGRDVVAPLLSRPVVEYCLSVPSWTWFERGRDRMVARTAFASRLPPEIIWRRGKGRLESLVAAAYLGQRRELGDLLLGGRLADNGLLDRSAIEAYLVRDLADGNFDYFRLIEIADVERWVRAVEAGAD